MDGGNVADQDFVWRTAADEGGGIRFEGEEDVIFTEVYLVDGQGRLAFATPIPGTENKALINVVDPTVISENFRQPYNGSYTSVVGLHGDIQADTDIEDLRTKYDRQELIADGHDGGTGVVRDGNTSEFIAFAPVSNTERPGTDAVADWVVVAHVPTGEAMAVSNTVRRDIIVIIGVALLGFVVLGLTIGRSTVKAITQVSDAAAAIANGELDTEIQATSRNDEIGDLIRSFQSMQTYLGDAADQATAIANQRFDDAALDREIPGTFGETFDTMATDVEQAQAEAETARQDAEQAKREAEELSEHLQEKATAFGTTMAHAADGDFTQRMDPESKSAAMTDIAEAFNAMMDDLEQTIGQIRAFADEVAASSAEVTTGADESQNASEQVSDSIQTITADAESQSENLHEVAGEMQSLSGTVEEVASSADEIASTSKKTSNLGEKGREAASEAMDEMAAIEEKSDETIDEIESLATEIDRIGEIVELITGIAEQTNMLALNASIEAARAGEAGEGFAVVADEIKQLAGEVAEATEEVESLIEEIQSSTSDAVTDIQEMDDSVSSGTETIEDALDALEEIATNVERVNGGIQEISVATDDQASSTEEIASMIDEVAEAADTVNAESDNVSAAAEEQTSALTQVSQNAVALADQAEDLQALLGEFTIDDRNV